MSPTDRANAAAVGDHASQDAGANGGSDGGGRGRSIESPALGALFRLTLASGVASAVALHLGRGAPVNGRDGKGRTPLILAAGRGHAHVCSLLLEAGADPWLCDEDGQDAFAAARAGRHSDVVTLLNSSARAGGDLSSAAAPSVGSSGPLASPTPAALPLVHPQPTPEDAEAVVPEAGDSRGDSALRSGGPEKAEFLDADVARSDADGPGCRDSVLVQAHLIEAGNAPSQSTGSECLSEEEASAIRWEAEAEPLLEVSESSVEQAASACQAALTRHTAMLPDPDWVEADVILPDPQPQWATAFVDPLMGHRAVLALIGNGLREGWTPADDIAVLMATATDAESGAALGEALCFVLDGLGVVVEAEHALDLEREAGLGPDRDDSSPRNADLVEAADLLGAVAGGFLDAETLLLAAASQASVLSANEEASLFRQLAASREAMLHHAARSPSSIPCLISWAEQLEGGALYPKDVSHAASGGVTRREGGIRQGSGEIEDVAASDDEQQAVSDPGAALLASRLRDVTKRLSSGQDARRSLADLTLTSPRVLQLAEAIATVEQPLHRQKRRTPHRLAAREDLGVLRRRPACQEARPPTHGITSALDSYLAAREQVVEANLRRVVWFARRYARSGAPFLDLVQEGQLGLLRAIDRYDIGRGFRFGTYAAWWIRQSMSRFIQDTARTVRIPVHLLERITKTKRHVEAFRAQFGFEPSVGDLARIMELDVDAIERALSADREIGAIDDAAEIGDEQLEAGQSAPNACVAELTDANTPLVASLHADLRKGLVTALKKLDRRQARILDLRFGISNGEPLTLEEVGTLYGVTRERIRQIERKALGSICRHLPSRHFESMVP